MVRLSVAMANYNHGAFLPERISSILSQISDSDELVIVDDASTDNSVKIIEEFAEKDTRVRLFKNEKNLGVVPTANRAFQESRGIYLTSLSADDRLLPGFIEKTMGLLLEHPEIPLCCSDCAMWFDGFSDIPPDRIYTTKLIPELSEKTIFPPQDIVRVFQKTTFWIPGHTTIVKRELVLAQGMLNIQFGYLCDWFLLHSIALTHGAAYIPEELSVWRQDLKSYSKQESASKKGEKLYLQLFRALCAPGQRELRPLFRKSLLMRLYIRKNLLPLMARPQYWDFLFYTVGLALRKRIGKFIAK